MTINQASTASATTSPASPDLRSADRSVVAKERIEETQDILWFIAKFTEMVNHKIYFMEFYRKYKKIHQFRQMVKQKKKK